MAELVPKSSPRSQGSSTPPRKGCEAIEPVDLAAKVLRCEKVAAADAAAEAALAADAVPSHSAPTAAAQSQHEEEALAADAVAARPAPTAAEGEDKDEALEVIEEPAKELGVSPEELGDALKDIEALDDLVTDKELTFSDVKDQLVAADEALEGGGEGEEGAGGLIKMSCKERGGRNRRSEK